MTLRWEVLPSAFATEQLVKLLACSPHCLCNAEEAVNGKLEAVNTNFALIGLT